MLEMELQTLQTQCDNLLRSSVEVVDIGGSDTASQRVTARSAFERLQQICFLLNLEMATDLYDNYVYDPDVLTYAEIRNILRLRVDFKPAVIAKLSLETRLLKKNE